MGQFKRETQKAIFAATSKLGKNAATVSQAGEASSTIKSGREKSLKQKTKAELVDYIKELQGNWL